MSNDMMYATAYGRLSGKILAAQVDLAIRGQADAYDILVGIFDGLSSVDAYVQDETKKNDEAFNIWMQSMHQEEPRDNRKD